MTELTGKLHGAKQTLKQTPAHYLMTALDEYLIAEYPDKVLGATIQLSIGIETLLKSKLETVEPCFIHHNLSWIKWKALRRSLRGVEVGAREVRLRSELCSLKHLPGHRTIDFSRAIELFHFVRPQSFQALRDLTRLRDYRNGLFHWKAEDTATFELSKLCLRIFLWVYKMVRREHEGHQLSGEVICMDPMLRKLQILNRLSEYVIAGNEDAFNFERRVYKYHKQYELIYRSEARLRGDIMIPDAILWGHACPACGFHEMKMHEIGAVRDGVRENRDVVANCQRCDFSASGKEQAHMTPDGYPTLVEIYDDLVRAIR